MIQRRFLLFAAIALAAVYVVWQQFPSHSVHRNRMIMGTLVEIQASGDDPLVLHQLVDSAFEAMQQVERLMSPHLPDSEVATLSGLSAMNLSAQTRDVIGAGLQVAERSQGAFDLTLGRLVKVWGLDGDSPRVPTAAEIDEALQGIGPKALRLEGGRLIKRDAALEVELGGIAKGYAVDMAARILADGGVTFASVNAGGDMRLVGRPGERDWRIGIQHPRRSGELLATLRVAEGAVVTSGDYERFFEEQGLRYHHLFDPRTGYPARGCQSVTVTAASAMLADALATAAFVLGPEFGLKLLEDWPGVEALVVAADGQVLQTAGLRERVVWPD